MTPSAFGPDRLRVPGLDLVLDFGALRVPEERAGELAPRLARALSDMAALEGGAIANPDEKRMVGHYWLRAPEHAPDPALRHTIETTLARIKEFAAQVCTGAIGPAPGQRYAHVLQLGIGGSALGPQLAADALGNPTDPLTIDFLDNTDPDGMQRVFARLGAEGLGATLVLCVSKSGGTAETRNALEEVRARLLAAGRDPARHLVAVTGEGSALERRAKDEGWVAIFPMWDWVGGRTSETSAVGLLPMALLGHDVDAFLAGARQMDAATLATDPEHNPALRLALAWYDATNGRGTKDMVILPYRDRLLLLSRYLQQLVMESLGKELDLEGRTVHQGLAVYGNKGSTDQHAFVQQLRDGLDNFFVTFIVALNDRTPQPLEVEPGTTSGDYLTGFFLGTRRALLEKGRRSITITVPVVDERSLGALIALFERAVGFYATLVGINAYHQPGVEAGKKAASRVLELQHALVQALEAEPSASRTATEWAAHAGHPELADEAWWVLAHLAANDRGVVREAAVSPDEDRFRRA